MSQDEAGQIIRSACPGPGGCGIAASFNTWGLPWRRSVCRCPLPVRFPPSTKPNVGMPGRRRRLRNLLERNVRPRDILTRRAFEMPRPRSRRSAVRPTACCIFWHWHGRPASISRCATCKPSSAARRSAAASPPRQADHGRSAPHRRHARAAEAFVASRNHGRRLPDRHRPDPGREPGRRARSAARPGTDRPAGLAFKPFADMQICFGNLAPDGIVFKVSSLQQPRFRGTAVCFDQARMWRSRSSSGGSGRDMSSCSATWAPSRRACPRC